MATRKLYLDTLPKNYLERDYVKALVGMGFQPEDMGGGWESFEFKLSGFGILITRQSNDLEREAGEPDVFRVSAWVPELDGEYGLQHFITEPFYDTDSEEQSYFGRFVTLDEVLNEVLRYTPLVEVTNADLVSTKCRHFPVCYKANYELHLNLYDMVGGGYFLDIYDEREDDGDARIYATREAVERDIQRIKEGKLDELEGLKATTNID